MITIDLKPKKKHSTSIQYLLLNPLPQTKIPQPYFTIPQPQPYQFPLSEYLIQGLKLLQHCTLKSQNNSIKQKFSNPRLARISKHKDYLFMLGYNGNGLLINNIFVDLKKVTAYSCWPNLLIIAYQDLRLELYTIQSTQIKLIKYFKNFTNQPISHIKILSVPKSYQNIIILTCTDKNISVQRIEKSIFYTLAVKVNKQLISQLKYPIAQITQIPNHLTQYLQRYKQYQNCSLIALTSVNTIIIIKINYQKLQSTQFATIDYHKQYPNQNITINTSSWGQQYIHSSSRNISRDALVLVYSFNSDIYELVLADSERDAGKGQWLQSHPLIIAEGNIVFCQFMKKSQLLLITNDTKDNKNNKILVFHTSQYSLFDTPISTQNIDKLIDKFTGILQARAIGYKSAEKNNLPIMEQLTEEEIIQVNQIPLISYSSTFEYDYQNNTIYYLTQKQLCSYQYWNWQQICRQLISVQKLQSAMLFLISIHKRINKFELGVQGKQKQISQCIHEVTKQFIKRKICLIKNNVVQITQENEYCLKIIAIPIELLLETQQYQYLFQTVKKQIIDTLAIQPTQYQIQKSTHLFYIVLQKFIQYGKLKYIPDTHLKELLQYYTLEKKFSILDRLSIFINAKLIDRSILIQNLVENSLVVSLAHVCIQGDQNQFLIPFVQFFGFCTHYQMEGNYQYAQIFAIRMLWYVQLCLQRHWVLKEYGDKKYKQMILLISYHFLNQNIVTKLLEIRTQYCLQTLAYYFTIQNAQIVQQMDIMQLGLQDMSIADWITRGGNYILEVLLSAIERYLQIAVNQLGTTNLTQTKNSQTLFHIFLSTITIYKTVKFHPQKYYRMIILLIKNHRLLKQIKYGLQPKTIQQYKQKHQTKNPQTIDRVLSSRYINKLITLVCYQYPQYMNKNIPVFLSEAHECQLLDVQTQIYFIQNNYSKCIDCYRYAEGEFNKNLIFQFLENALKKLTTQKRKNDKLKLTKSISKNILWMVQLNPKSTILIIQNFIQEMQNNLIQALAGKQLLQLEFLEFIIYNEHLMRQKLNQKSMNKYIELMVKYKKGKLIEVFKNNAKFINEDAIKICQGYRVYDCLQYLYEQIGNISSSIKVCILRMQQLFIQYKNYQQNIDNQQYQYQTFDFKIKQLLQHVIATCQIHNSEQHWETLLDSWIELYNKYRNDTRFEKQWESFLYISGEITHQLIQNCSIQYIIGLIHDRYKGLTMGGHMNTIFRDTLNNLSYTIDIFHLAKRLNINYFNRLEKRNYESKLHSYFSGLKCEICKSSIMDKQKSVHFMCGHGYHSKCIFWRDGTICMYCLMGEQQLINYHLHTMGPVQSLKVPKISDELHQFTKTLPKKLQITNYPNISQQHHINKQLQQYNVTQIRKQRILEMTNYDKWISMDEDTNRKMLIMLDN